MHFQERLHIFGKDWATLSLMHCIVSEHSEVCAISGLSGSSLPLLLIQFPSSRLVAIQYCTFSDLKAHWQSGLHNSQEEGHFPSRIAQFSKASLKLSRAKSIDQVMG